MYDYDSDDDLLNENPDDDWQADVPYDDDEPDELPCPNCDALIAEDSVRCPICGEYVTWDTRAWTGKPWWWIVLGLAGIMAFIASVMATMGLL
jgi:hypothetical protein